jgi:hypothetical protein
MRHRKKNQNYRFHVLLQCEQRYYKKNIHIEFDILFFCAGRAVFREKHSKLKLKGREFRRLNLRLKKILTEV